MKDFRVGQHLESRDGKRWRILAINVQSNLSPIVALRMYDGELSRPDSDGKIFYEVMDSPNDLITLWDYEKVVEKKENIK